MKKEKIRGIDKRVTREHLAKLAGVTIHGVIKALGKGVINTTYPDSPEFHLMDQSVLNWMYRDTCRRSGRMAQTRFERLDIGLPVVKEYIGKPKEEPKPAKSKPKAKPTSKPESTAKSRVLEFLTKVEGRFGALEDEIKEVKSTQEALLSLMGLIEDKLSIAISNRKKCDPIKDVGDASQYDDKSCEDMLQDLNDVPDAERTVYTAVWLDTISRWKESGNDFTIKHKQIILATWISQFQN